MQKQGAAKFYSAVAHLPGKLFTLQRRAKGSNPNPPNIVIRDIVARSGRSISIIPVR
ncbi:hypothetical protein ACPOL_1080 [Acidisarcina polymorpha]|uniref:Uncharacterized protein n=1 Tax=Acidisarcina polymorpha TaxID=2211140 RepID=A0A2Z5FUA9_9BACT|nr:hypothetical protein ACPOL_1080 [Acidisarcina polymorpha]